MIVPRVKVEFDRAPIPFGGEVKRDGTLGRKGFMAEFRTARFNADRCPQIECSVGELKSVATKIGHRTTPKIVPATPLAGMIDLVVIGAIRCRP